MGTLIICSFEHLYSRDDMILENCREVVSAQELVRAALERPNGAGEGFVLRGKHCERALGCKGFSQASSLQCDHEGGEVDVPGCNIDDRHVLQSRRCHIIYQRWLQ